MKKGWHLNDANLYYIKNRCSKYVFSGIPQKHISIKHVSGKIKYSAPHSKRMHANRAKGFRHRVCGEPPKAC